MEPNDIRERTNQEDTLLGNRTTAFLLGNGFLMAAFGITGDTFEKHVMAALGVGISLIWLLVAWQSRQAITALHEIFLNHYPNDKINTLIFERILWKRKVVMTAFGPTELMAFWLPGVVLAAWTVINVNLLF